MYPEQKYSLAFLKRLVCVFSTEPRDWLGRTPLKWPILCRVGHKTLLSVSVSCYNRWFSSVVKLSCSAVNILLICDIMIQCCLYICMYVRTCS